MSFSPTVRAWVVGATSLCGLVLSGIAERLHRQLAADASYTSFCNINSNVNCDVVLTSPWAYFFSIPVSLLGIMFYAALTALALAVVYAGSSPRRRQLANLLFFGAIAGFVFSLYMAGVALGVLGTVCLVCSGLYLVATVNVLAAWSLRKSLVPAYRRSSIGAARSARREWALGIALLSVLGVAVIWELSHGLRGGSAQRVEPSAEFTAWFTAQPVVEVPLDGRNQRGRPDAPVSIVEFSDFECGHCNNFHRVVEEAWRREPRRIRILFRHFPLNSNCNPSVPSSFHSMACTAAIAAECAGRQGKFWEYHDLLFRHQKELRDDRIIALAAQLGLALPAFRSCLSDPAVREQVERDAQLGAALGVNSTPTVFINGRMVRGALNAADLQRAIALAAGKDRP